MWSLLVILGGDFSVIETLIAEVKALRDELAEEKQSRVQLNEELSVLKKG